MKPEAFLELIERLVLLQVVRSDYKLRFQGRCPIGKRALEHLLLTRLLHRPRGMHKRISLEKPLLMRNDNQRDLTSRHTPLNYPLLLGVKFEDEPAIGLRVVVDLLLEIEEGLREERMDLLREVLVRVPDQNIYD